MSVDVYRTMGCTVEVDRADQVLRLAIDETATWSETTRHAGRRQEGEFEVFDVEGGERFESPLYPSVAAIPDEGPFACAATLAQKAKAVDDGVIAALEQILDEGCRGLAGRRDLLAAWRHRLEAEWGSDPQAPGLAEAIARVAGAQHLVADPPADPASWPVALRLRRARDLRELRSNPEEETPLGVHSWSDRLARLYRQGKLLQRPLHADAAGHLARVLGAEPEMRAAYLGHLGLLALTNPLVGPGLLDPDPDASRAPFPASETPEGRLVKDLIGDRPVPPGFDLVGELIARVEGGEIDLAPGDESGWYDRVLHALEPLVRPDRAPEAPRLRLAENYRDDLRGLFRALLGQARETHVKQVECPTAGGCPLVIAPRLTVEPLAEHYRRRADSYRFVRETLAARLGEAVLRSRRRPTEDGGAAGPLLDELVEMEQLYDGARAIALDELGLGFDADGPEGRRLLAARAWARRWVEGRRSDPDLARDARMMVPLFRDAGRREFHVLAVVGFERKSLAVDFAERPGLVVRQAERPREVVWSGALYPLARPVVLTCRTRRLLDRPAFRALCDRHRTASAIRAALEG